MLQRFRRLPLAHYRRILAVTLVIFLTIGVILVWRDSSLVEQVATKATQQKLLVLARAGARSTERMLSLFKVELAILERKEEIKNQDTVETRKLLTEILTSVNLPIVHQLGLISKDGILLVIANKEGKRENEGNSLADKEYFQWAKKAKEGDFFLSEPVVDRSGTNKGEWVVVLATPIIKKDGGFNGCLFAPIRLDDLTIGYIDTLKISPTTVGYVINKDGVVLSSQFEDLIGINIREYTQREKWQGYETYLGMINQMVQGEEGVGVYYFAGTDKKVGKWVSSFAPVRINGNTIMVATAVPFEWTYDLVTNFYKNQIIWLAFLIIIGIVIAFFWISGLYLARYDGYNRGLKDGGNFKKGENQT